MLVKRSAQLLIAAAMMITAVSCSKDPVTEPIPTQPNSLLNVIEQDPFNYVSLDYTTDSLVQKFNIVTNSFTDETTVTYGANKKPIQALTSGLKVNFIYTDGKLDKIEYGTANNPNNTVLAFTKFDYFNNRVRLATTYSKQGSNFAANTEVVYEYFDNGDLKTQTTLQATTPNHFDRVESTDYEYDNNHNPLKISDEIALLLSLGNPKHNITRQKHFDSQAVLVEQVSYAYEYNAAGYPVKGIETTAYTGQQPTTQTITYKYK